MVGILRILCITCFRRQYREREEVNESENDLMDEELTESQQQGELHLKNYRRYRNMFYISSLIGVFSTLFFLILSTIATIFFNRFWYVLVLCWGVFLIVSFLSCFTVVYLYFLKSRQLKKRKQILLRCDLLDENDFEPLKGLKSVGGRIKDLLNVQEKDKHDEKNNEKNNKENNNNTTLKEKLKFLNRKYHHHSLHSSSSSSSDDDDDEEEEEEEDGDDDASSSFSSSKKRIKTTSSSSRKYKELISYPPKNEFTSFDPSLSSERTTTTTIKKHQHQQHQPEQEREDLLPSNSNNSNNNDFGKKNNYSYNNFSRINDNNSNSSVNDSIRTFYGKEQGENENEENQLLENEEDDDTELDAFTSDMSSDDSVFD